MNPGRATTDFSEAELRDYACEHLLYEITHLVRAVQAIDSAKAGQFPMNFAIEVFALHLRNLLDFFVPGRVHRTDVCAHHFLADWRPPVLTPTVKKARWMANKQVAHLTTDRTADVAAKTWDLGPIIEWLRPVIQQFADEADLVCASFPRHVAERLAELPR